MIALLVGLIAGGLVTAAAVLVASGLTSWVPDSARPWLVGAVAGLCLARDLELIRLPLPQRRWQVPKTILEQAPPQAALGFGFELGLGFRTFVPSSVPYLLVVAMVLLLEPWWMFFAVGAAFAVGRFVMALARYMSSPGAIWDGFMAAYGPPVKLASILVAVPAFMALAV